MSHSDFNLLYRNRKLWVVIPGGLYTRRGTKFVKLSPEFIPSLNKKLNVFLKKVLLPIPTIEVMEVKPEKVVVVRTPNKTDFAESLLHSVAKEVKAKLVKVPARPTAVTARRQVPGLPTRPVYRFRKNGQEATAFVENGDKLVLGSRVYDLQDPTVFEQIMKQGEKRHGWMGTREERRNFMQRKADAAAHTNPRLKKMVDKFRQRSAKKKKP